ncbi:hypothetical protein EJB05_46529, partial [Eragrostis curvula]
MGFAVTSLIFLLAGFVSCLFTLLCCNRGPSTNLYARLSLVFPFSHSIRSCWTLIRDGTWLLAWGFGFHLTLVVTAVICAWMMYAIVYLAQMKPLINPILSGE